MRLRASNEGKVIDAVIRLIEERDGVSRRGVRDPERERHSSPVDQTCVLGEVLYAFEHTEIEPFAKYIEMRMHNEELLAPIVESLKDLAGADEYYRLLVPIDASIGIRNGDRESVRSALIAWIRQEPTKIQLHASNSMVRPPNIPFSVALNRYKQPASVPNYYPFFYIQCAPDSDIIERSRIDRLKQACVKKFGKLAAWKDKHRARSIIIFEDNDVALSNESLIAAAFSEAETNRTDCPDEAYLVATHAPTWYVCCLRRLETTYFENDERPWIIDPATLVDLTGR